MLFIALRLSKIQFLVAGSFYLPITTMQYVDIYANLSSQGDWRPYGGFYIQGNKGGVEPSVLDITLGLILSGYSGSFIY